MKTFYAILTMIGILVSEIVLYFFLREYGFDLSEFARQAFASPVATLVSTDVILSSLVVWGFMAREARKHKIGYLWVFVAMNLLIGLCAALPAFLYVRQGRIEQPATAAAYN